MRYEGLKKRTGAKKGCSKCEKMQGRGQYLVAQSFDDLLPVRP